MFKKVAAAALMLASTVSVAQATSAQALSLSNVPAARASTAVRDGNKQLGAINPLYFIVGIVGIVAVLEITGAINIFESDSP